MWAVYTLLVVFSMHTLTAKAALMNRPWSSKGVFPYSDDSMVRGQRHFAFNRMGRRSNPEKKQDQSNEFGDPEQFMLQLSQLSGEQKARVLNELAPREWKEAVLRHLLAMKSRGFDVQTISDSDADAEPDSALRFLRVY